MTLILGGLPEPVMTILVKSNAEPISTAYPEFVVLIKITEAGKMLMLAH